PHLTLQKLLLPRSPLPFSCARQGRGSSFVEHYNSQQERHAICDRGQPQSSPNRARACLAMVTPSSVLSAGDTAYSRKPRQARFPDGKPSPKTGIHNDNYPRTDVSDGPVRLGRRNRRAARADRATRPPTLQTQVPHTYESTHCRAVGTPAHLAQPAVGQYHYNPTYKGATSR